MSSNFLVFFNRVGLLYLILFISFYNSVIRLDVDSFSLYRLLVPLQILLLFFVSVKKFNTLLFFSFSVLFIGFFCLLFSGYQLVGLNLMFFTLYFLLFLTFFSVSCLYDKDNDHRLYFFIKCQFAFLILFGFGSLMGVVLPNVEYKVGTINGVFLSENDYSLAIVAFAFVFIFHTKSAVKSFLVFTVVMSISFYNDSKICMIFLFLYYIYTYFVFDFKLSSQLRAPFFIIGICVFSLFCNLLFNYEISFSGGSYRLVDLLLEPVIRIFTLEPYGSMYGSVHNRTDLIIYGLRDFFTSYGLGIGFGNTLQMIETGKYAVIGGAKSLHNFPLQFIVELGAGISLFVGYFLLKNTNTFTKVTLFFLLLTSLSQSVGLFSNYYFFVCLFFIILVGKKHR